MLHRRPLTSLTACLLRPPLLRKHAAEDELEHLCARWNIEYRAPTAGERSTACKKRHKQLNDYCHGRRRDHLAALQQQDRARVADSHPDPALAGRVVMLLNEHKVGNAVVGLVVRAGSVVEPVDAHLLAVPVGGEMEPAPTPSPAAGASTNVPMIVTPPRRSTRRLNQRCTLSGLPSTNWALSGASSTCIDKLQLLSTCRSCNSMPLPTALSDHSELAESGTSTCCAPSRRP